jgi:integrase
MQNILICSGHPKHELIKGQKLAWTLEKLPNHFSDHLCCEAIPIHASLLFEMPSGPDVLISSAELKPLAGNIVGRILSAAKEEPYRTMFWVAALTGLRAGEICGLPAESVDFNRKTISVTQSAWYGQLQAPKSRSAVRTVPIPGILSDVLRAYLREWKPNPDRLLFATRTGKPHTSNKVVQRKLWPILDSLKIPRAGFHAFRHAASTLLIDLGASPATVQAQLGHSDPRITLSAYSHTVDKSQRKAVERLAKILIPNDAKTVVTTNSRKWIQ